MTNIFKSTLLWLSFVLLATVSFTACSDEDKDEVAQSRVEIADFTVDQTEGAITLEFFAAANWTASLSSTSWIQLDPTTRSGGAGESKLKLEWQENTGVSERKSTLLLQIGNEPTYRIEVMQYPDQPVIVVSKTQLNLEVRPEAAGGKGLFTDTLVVNSNIRWDIEGLPSWVTLDANGEPAEGRQTTIRLIFTGDASKFNKAEMTGSFKLTRISTPTVESVLDIKAVSTIDAINEEGASIQQIVMAPSPIVQDRYYAEFKIISNTDWELKNIPDWVATSTIDNATAYEGSLQTEQTVRFMMENLDTERLSQKLQFTSAKTGAIKEVDLIFPGTGDDFFEVALYFQPDFEFAASAYDSNWNPLPSAKLDLPFSITSRAYTNPNDAPYTIYFVKYENGWTYAEEATWVGVEAVQGLATRAQLVTKEFDLYVNDRRMGYDPNPTQKREALMLAVPKGVAFEELFIEWTEDLKPEYEEKTYRITQSALSGGSTNFFADFADEDTIPAAGITKIYRFETDAENFSVFAEAPEWAHVVDLVRDEFSGEVVGVEVIYEPNTTKELRVTNIHFTNYNTQIGDEETLFTLFVEQLGE